MNPLTPLLPILKGNVLFGLLAAFFWGGGDFSGGMAVKHTGGAPGSRPDGTLGSRPGGTLGGTLRVLLLSHFSSLSVLLLIVLLRGAPFPHGAPLAWGLVAGIAAGLSLSCFYIALARGAMGAPAAVSGLLAAAIPAALTLFREGSPGPQKLLGFLIAGLAIWWIVGSPTAPNPAADRATGSSTMLLASLAGAGFGIYFIALKMAATSGILWPLVTARVGSLTTCGLMLLGLSLRPNSNPSHAPNTRARLTRTAVRWVFFTAILDTSGNLFFLAATRAGRLDIASVLASLYPASTILLAAWLLKERVSRRQALGMAIAVLAVVLITL